ncbi:MAG: NUDIX domain-containing protein [Helicobacter sp.]|nr:NUDIX domain-containing protein [Helicobacter sp.]
MYKNKNLKNTTKVDKTSLKLSPLHVLDPLDGTNAKYIRAKKLDFIENGTRKTWEILSGFDSVCILLFDTTKQAFVIVKQFRPAVFLKQNDAFAHTNDFKDMDFELGYTYELCAGLLDKPKSLHETAAEEVLEECGYEISPNELHYIGKFFGSTSLNGSINHIFFAEVNEEKRKNTGGGVDGEVIDIIYVPLHESLTFALDPNIPKTTSLSFGISWYHYHFKGAK